MNSRAKTNLFVRSREKKKKDLTMKLILMGESYPVAHTDDQKQFFAGLARRVEQIEFTFEMHFSIDAPTPWMIRLPGHVRKGHSAARCLPEEHGVHRNLRVLWNNQMLGDLWGTSFCVYPLDGKIGDANDDASRVKTMRRGQEGQIVVRITSRII